MITGQLKGHKFRSHTAKLPLPGPFCKAPNLHPLMRQIKVTLVEGKFYSVNALETDNYYNCYKACQHTSQ